MKSRWSGAATILVILLAALAGTACTNTSPGTARPAPGLKPRPLTGESVRRVLLDDAALSRMLSQPFVSRKPLEFGGPDKLNHSDNEPSPADCLGVTTMLRKSVYASAEVKDVASESWWNNGEPAQVLNVMEGVVTLPTAAAAEALFAKFSDQWRQCNGATTTEQSGPISTTNVISDVRVANTVLAATNTATSVLPEMPPLQPTPQARAIGVRMNCIVEVTVVFFGGRRPSDPGSAKVDTSAVDIANAVMDKITAAS